MVQYYKVGLYQEQYLVPGQQLVKVMTIRRIMRANCSLTAMVVIMDMLVNTQKLHSSESSIRGVQGHAPISLRHSFVQRRADLSIGYMYSRSIPSSSTHHQGVLQLKNIFRRVRPVLIVRDKSKPKFETVVARYTCKLYHLRQFVD